MSAAKRPPTNAGMVFQVIERAQPQPLAAGDVAARLPLERRSIYEAFDYLRARGFLRYVQGSKRLCEIVPGAAAPADGRGLAPNSRKALQRVATLRRVASRPIGQFTAAARSRATRKRLKGGGL
jgi:DNA-binding IclR family transcriptional regulator